MTEYERPVHIMNPPILEAKEIPYDPADMGPGSFVLELEFNSEEMDQLGARSSRGREPLTHFIKRAALEAAAREGKPQSGDAHAAD